MNSVLRNEDTKVRTLKAKDSFMEEVHIYVLINESPD